MLVDLRSDTVTRPTTAMRRAMADAEVGDDEYGEDPTVNRLQEVYAELTGKQAALFVPSGTMANQVALRTLARPGDAVVAGAHQHIVRFEAGAGPLNAGVTFLAVPDDDGTLRPSDVEGAIESERHHQPHVALIAAETTHMAAGGRVYPLDRWAAIADLAGRAGVPIHLDGARLWNASVAADAPLSAWTGSATTVTSCLSKGLGAPVGSLLAGPADLIEEAKLHRKRLGGAMRQSGILAAAGLVALDGWRERLAGDHRRARLLADAVAIRWPDCGTGPDGVDTNIVVFAPPDAARLVGHLEAEGVLAGTVGPGLVRLVTHSDVDDDGIALAVKAIAGAP